jgi:hypothetical protein
VIGGAGDPAIWRPESRGMPCQCGGARREARDRNSDRGRPRPRPSTAGAGGSGTSARRPAARQLCRSGGGSDFVRAPTVVRLRGRRPYVPPRSFPADGFGGSWRRHSSSRG